MDTPGPITTPADGYLGHAVLARRMTVEDWVRMARLSSKREMGSATPAECEELDILRYTARCETGV